MKNGKNYEAWKIKLEDFYKKWGIEEQIIFFTRFGILAPSIHNTQPWKFVIKNQTLKIRPDWNYHLRASDHSGKNLYISIGKCTKNIEVVAEYFGYKTDTTIETENENSYVVKMIFLKSHRVGKNLSSLAPYIMKRFSNKLFYLSKSVSKEAILELKRQTMSGATLILIDDKEKIQNIAHLTGKASRNVATKEFTTELSQWVRGNHTKKYDGMPGFVEGFTSIKSLTGKYILRFFPKKILIKLAIKNEIVLKTSPLIGIITTSATDNKSAINIGRFYEQLALTATKFNINCTPMHAVIEDETSLKELVKLLKLKKERPVFLFRMGYSNNSSYHTPRRQIEKFYTLNTNSEDSEKNLIKIIDVPITVNKVTINNYKINYITAGSGKPLLLIHGANIGWGQWYANIAELSKHFKLYAIDLPGCGNSTYIDFRNSELEKDFVDIVEKFIKIKKLQKVTVIGHSFSTAIIIKLVLRNNPSIDKIVLISPLGFTNKTPLLHKLLSIQAFAKFISKTAMKPTRVNMKKFLVDVLIDKSQVREEFVDYYYNAVKNKKTCHPLLFMSSLMKRFKLKEELVFINKLNKINKPTLIIAGDRDPIIPNSKILESSRLIPNVKINIFKNVGHVPPLENSAKFNKLVVNFINK